MPSYKTYVIMAVCAEKDGPLWQKEFALHACVSLRVNHLILNAALHLPEDVRRKRGFVRC